MPLCGFNEIMINGLGLLGFSKLVTEVLKKMDSRYYRVLRPKYGAEKALRLLAEEYGSRKDLTCEQLKGITLFARGLYEQAKKRAAEDGISLEESYDTEIREMDIFFSYLNKK